MKTVIFYGPRQIRLTDVPVPKPGPGEVLIQVHAALTCGTDFKAYRQGHRVLLGDPPSPFGHESAGTVAEVGSGITRFKTGMRVVAANSAPYDGCFFCAHDQPQLCDHLRLHNGAYAEYDLIPAHIVRHNLYELDPAVDFKVAALTEPLACAVHAVDVMGIQSGETVVILGAGNMALLLIQALHGRGAKIIVVGRGPERLKMASEAGADDAISVLQSDPVSGARRLTQNLGADCVFEAVGRPETWQQAIAMTRKGGRICLFGGCAGGTQVQIDAHRLHYEQLQLQGVFHHTPKHFRRALDLLTQGKVETDILIRGQIALTEVPSYFERMHEKSPPKTTVIP